jgi:predicted AAA+ superfamily ATPase
MTDYYHRDLAPTVISAIEEMPVVVITGMRQTGKTTFLRKQPGLSPRGFGEIRSEPFRTLPEADA